MLRTLFQDSKNQVTQTSGLLLCKGVILCDKN
nr:MAG TPA: hypothetical protein [Caudoviricetes sp.]